jgi:hypothetical protein
MKKQPHNQPKNQTQKLVELDEKSLKSVVGGTGGNTGGGGGGGGPPPPK